MASLMKNLAPDYDSTKSYVSGDRVLYNKNLYICTKATTGSFDAECWTEIFLSDLIKGSSNSDLGGNFEVFMCFSGAETYDFTVPQDCNLIIYGRTSWSETTVTLTINNTDPVSLKQFLPFSLKSGDIIRLATSGATSHACMCRLFTTYDIADYYYVAQNITDKALSVTIPTSTTVYMFGRNSWQGASSIAMSLNGTDVSTHTLNWCKYTILNCVADDEVSVYFNTAVSTSHCDQCIIYRK